MYETDGFKKRFMCRIELICQKQILVLSIRYNVWKLWMSFIFFRWRNLFFLAQYPNWGQECLIWVSFTPDDLCSLASYEAPRSLFPVAARTYGVIELETPLYLSLASTPKYIVILGGTTASWTFTVLDCSYIPKRRRHIGQSRNNGSLL
jgi:hypothetical protein